MPLVEVQLLLFYTSVGLGVGKKTEVMTDKQWKPHIASWQTKEEGDVGSLASFDCKVPGFGCIFAHAHGWLEGWGGDSKDTEEGTGWGEKESRRANIPKRTKPTTSGEPQRDRNPGKNSCDRARWAKRANWLQARDTSRTLVVLLQR